MTLATHQVNKLGELLGTIRKGNRFYSGKLSAAGVNGNLASLEDFAARVPFTSKEEIERDQAKHPPYGSNLTYALERYTRFSQTSGTTGKPIRWLDTPESWDWMLDCWTRVYEAAGIVPEDRVFFPFSFGPFLGFWVAFEAATRMGCLSIPGGGMRSTARLQTILENDVTVLCCTPTYAVRLAEVALEEKIDLSAAKVRTIIVAGEPGGCIPATRTLIEKLWPTARVADHHGMTEMGPVSYECPARPGVLHIIETAYLPEVVDTSSLEPIGPGGTGELVLTNLGRTGSPLLRYRTGDLVRRAEQTLCECGSSEMALEGGILSRTDDMLVVRGVNVYPSAVEEIVRSCGQIAEFQVEICTGQSLPEMSIQIEPAPAGSNPAELADRIAGAMHDAFGLRVPVSALPPGSLPRFEAKAKRWVRR
jgi:phenylacetate-CoA ligase